MVKMEQENRTQYPYFFFKIMIPTLTEHHLKLPPKFLRQMKISEEMSNNVTLKGLNGVHGRAKLSHRDDGTYIADGWEKFFTDNGLGNVEFLIFSYWGNLFFEVEICDKNGCKRATNSGTNQWKCTIAKPTGKKRGRPCKNVAGSAKLATATTKPVNPFGKRRGRPPKQTAGGSASLLLSSAYQGNMEPKAKADKVIKTEDVFWPVPDMDLQAGSSTSTKTGTVEGRQARMLKDVQSFTSPHPYFKRCLKHIRSLSVHVPIGFAKYFPRRNVEVILQGPRGEARTATIRFNKLKQYVISKGWAYFVGKYNLEEGDICIFELTGKFKFQLHVFPVGDRSK